MEPIVGLQATKAEGQIIIGGYDKDIVRDLNNVQWLQSSNETQWEITLSRVDVGGYTLALLDQNQGLKARISASEPGIVLPYSRFKDI